MLLREQELGREGRKKVAEGLLYCSGWRESGWGELLGGQGLRKRLGRAVGWRDAGHGFGQEMAIGREGVPRPRFP